MSQIITEQTFDELHHIVYNYQTGIVPVEVLDKVKSLFYYNKEGDLKNSDKYLGKSYYNYLFIAYKMEDKSIYQILDGVISQYLGENQLFLDSLIHQDYQIFVELLPLAYKKWVHYYGYISEDGEYKLLKSLIENHKPDMLQLLLQSDYDKKFIHYLHKTCTYPNGIGELSPAKCKNLKFNLLTICLLYDDIVSLNILLNANPKLIKLIKFETLPITLRESLTYLKIVKAQGLAKAQTMFGFNDNAHNFKQTNERMQLMIKNMPKEDIEKLTRGVAKIKPSIMAISSNNQKEKKASIVSSLKNIFTSKNNLKKEQNKENQTLNISILDDDIVNYFFNLLETNFIHLEEEEKASIHSLKELIFKILSLGEMSVKIKSDILLILQKTLPNLITSYDALLKKDNAQRMLYLPELLRSFHLLENKFEEHYQELNTLHTQKLALNFAEQVTFVEQKCLHHGH